MREAAISKKVIAGLLVGALFLYLTIRQIDLVSCSYYIRQANFNFVLLAVLVYSCAFFVRALRWKFLLAPLKVFSAVRLFFFLQLGFFMNNLLPLRLGELIRVHVTGQKVNVPRSGVLATVVLERLFDGLSYVCLFLLTILFLPFPGWAKKSLTAGSLLFIGALALLFFLVRHQGTAGKLFLRLPVPDRFRQRMHSILMNFISGLQIFSHGSGLLKVFLLSLVVWTIEGSVFYTLAQAFHLDINMFQGFLVMIIIGLGSILPTAPGYVGTVEFLGVTSLTFLGVDKNLAFGYIITLHLLQLLSIAFWGITGMVREKISFSEIIHLEKQPQI